MTKPSLPQGTRDFGPDTVRKRNYILTTIKNVFELYGFQPLETPAMENIETLMGKYGEEGDRLIFRVLESGVPFKRKFIKVFLSGLKEYLKDATKNIDDINIKLKENFNLNQLSTDLGKADLDAIAFYFENILSNDDASKKYVPKLKTFISEKALKYDLTIPFARYVAMNRNQLTFPFKRYQIQPVWRADRPQKGRYREFYQCDADVVGSNSLLNEVELINIYITVFEKLGISKFDYAREHNGYFIKINNRKILTALAEVCEIANKFSEITTSIDKIDKVGIDKVKEELSQRGLSNNQINIVEEYLSIIGTNEEILFQLKKLFGDNVNGKKGIEELEFIINCISPKNFIDIDVSLARGLNYYTGLIVEVNMPHSLNINLNIGSIGGGGRYDDLTGLFGVPGIPGVGISFGVDRIYDVMEELNLFPADIHVGTQVLFLNWGEKESLRSFELMQQLRGKGVRCELYHEVTKKIDTQFKYAEKKNIPFVATVGEEELRTGTCKIKNIITGQQQTIPQQELINYKF